MVCKGLCLPTISPFQYDKYPDNLFTDNKHLDSFGVIGCTFRVEMQLSFPYEFLCSTAIYRFLFEITAVVIYY